MRKIAFLLFILLNIRLVAQEIPPSDDSLMVSAAAAQKLTEQGLYLDAVKAALLKEDDKAIQLFESLLTKYPDNIPSKYELAQIYLRKKDYTRGTELIKKQLRLIQRIFGTKSYLPIIMSHRAITGNGQSF